MTTYGVNAENRCNQYCFNNLICHYYYDIIMCYNINQSELMLNCLSLST